MMANLGIKSNSSARVPAQLRPQRFHFPFHTVDSFQQIQHDRQCFRIDLQVLMQSYQALGLSQLCNGDAGSLFDRHDLDQIQGVEVIDEAHIESVMLAKYLYCDIRFLLHDALLLDLSQLCEEFDLLCIEVLRQLDLELNKEIAKLAIFLVDREAFVF
jgi:hypothetical protein